MMEQQQSLSNIDQVVEDIYNEDCMSDDDISESELLAELEVCKYLTLLPSSQLEWHTIYDDSPS